MANMTDVYGESRAGTEMAQNGDIIHINKEMQLAVLCDGEGRRTSGKTASAIGIETIISFLGTHAKNSGTDGTFSEGEHESSCSAEENRIIKAIQQANTEIYKASKTDPKLYGMFSTIAAAHFSHEGMCLASVGNSRIYRIRDNQIKQISADHTLLNDYKKMNTPAPDYIGKNPKKNITVRALGTKDTVKVDTFYETPNPGDIYLLSTDGLWQYANDALLLDIYRKNSKKLRDVCHDMTRAAVQNGSKDDISVILIRTMP